VKVQESVKYLERHSLRGVLDGDLDLDSIQYWMNELHNNPDKITPDLARRAHSAIDVLQNMINSKMEEVGTTMGSLQEGKKALRGYANFGMKNSARYLHRNV